MIDGEFSTGAPEWSVVHLTVYESYRSALVWLLPRVEAGDYSIVSGREYWTFYLRDADLAFELKMRFG